MVFLTFWGALRCEKSSARCEIGWPFGNNFLLKIEKLVSTDPKLSQKSEIVPFGIYVKLDAEKGRKSMPEGSQNDVKMYAEIIDCSCFYEKGGNAPNYLVYTRKRGSGHLKIGEKPSNICGKASSENEMPKGAKINRTRANIEPKIHPKLPKRAKAGGKGSPDRPKTLKK